MALVNTPVDERGQYPIMQALVALGAQCREMEAEREAELESQS